jgi:hypothetical protein
MTVEVNIRIKLLPPSSGREVETIGLCFTEVLVPIMYGVPAYEITIEVMTPSFNILDFQMLITSLKSQIN